MNKDTEFAARVAWGEARNQGVEGLQAVLNVMVNRTKQRGRPDTIGAVARQRFQFSAYNDNDPNKTKLLAVDETNPEFVSALRLARQASAGDLPDITGGATHYHTRQIAAPYWADGATITARIGDHIFYKDVA